MNPLEKLRVLLSETNNAGSYPRYLVGETVDRFPERGLHVSLVPKRVFQVLTFTVCVLTALSLTTHLTHYIFGFPLIDSLVVDKEDNIPTFYSTLSLAACSALLSIIGLHKSRLRDRSSKGWYGLAFIFLLLSLDESSSIHERAVHILRPMLDAQGILYFTWVIPGFAFVTVFSISYFKFWRSLPASIRYLCLLSALLFLSGALGMEMVGGIIASATGESNLLYALTTTIEELLEKMGIVVFIYTLLRYIQKYVGPIHVHARP